MSKEIIFKVVLEDGEYKAKLDQIGQASERAEDGVKTFADTTRTLGTQLRQGVGFSEFKKGADEVTSSLQSQKRVVEQIEQDIKDLNKALSNTAPGKAQQELQREVNAANKALREEAAILKGLDAETKKASASQQTLTSKARELKNELVALELAGKRDTDQFRALSAEAAKLTDSISSVNETTKTLASSTIVFDAFSQGIQGVAGGFAAAQGAAALFGDENEDIGKALLKVQGALAVTNGLQQVFNALNKDSAFLTVLNTKATVAASAVMRAFGASVSTTATSFKVLRGAIIATGLGAIVVLLGAIISKFSEVSDSTKDATSAAEDFQKALENAAKASQDIQTRALNAVIDRAVAEGRLSEEKGEQLKLEREITRSIIDRRKQLGEDIFLAQEANKEQVQSIANKERELELQREIVRLKSAGKETAPARIVQLESEIFNIKAKFIGDETKLREQAQKDIDNLNSILANEGVTREINAAKKAAKGVKKEKIKINDEFEKLVIALFEGTLDEEEKLIFNSEREKNKLRKAFLTLNKKEQEQQAINLANGILQIEENLQEDILELNKTKRKKIFDEQQKAIEDAKKLRLADLDEEALGIENQVTEAELLRTGSFQSELGFINTLRKNEDLRYENEKKQLEEIGASEETLNQARLRNRANLKAIDDAEFNLRKQRNEEIFQQTVTLFNNLLSFESSINARNLADLQAKNQAELEAFQGTEEAKERLRLQFEQKERQAKIKQAEADKRAAIFNAIINTAVGVTKVISNPILAALIAASGALQIAAIAAQPLPRFEKGGLIKGKSHRQGGTLIEAERDEFVINKNSTRKHKPFVEAINKNDGSFERLIFKKFILPETLGLDRNQNILVNASLKSDKLENEMRKNRKQEIENTKVLASLLKSNQSLSQRFKW